MHIQYAVGARPPARRTRPCRLVVAPPACRTHTRPLHAPPPQNKHAAQRALLRAGDQLSSTLLVGVKPLDAAHRQAVERQLGSGAVSSAMSFPKPSAAQLRPYALDGAAAASTVVPLPATGAWSKFAEFVLGI